MASKRLRPFCAAGHTCLSIAACGGAALLLCGPSHRGNAAHLSPLFMLYAQNYGPVPQNKTKQKKKKREKGVYEGPAENWPKTLCFSFFLWHPPLFKPPAPDLCFSHKFLPRMEKHVCGSRSHDTHLGSERRREIPGHEMFRAS